MPSAHTLPFLKTSSREPQRLLLAGDFNMYFPAPLFGRQLQALPQGLHGRIFRGKVAAIKQPQTGLLSPARHGMLLPRR